MKILILEDREERINYFSELFKFQELYIARTIEEAKNYCNYIIFDSMFLDHDLDNRIWVNPNEENTGYQFVKWLIEKNMQSQSLNYIHSCNPIGANKMLNLLLDNGRDGIWIPFYLILQMEDKK